MSRFNEPKSPLTSARMFDKKSDAELADWLDNDAQALDGQPGRNNHVAATRAAAERLRRTAEQADREPSADEVEAGCKAFYEGAQGITSWERMKTAEPDLADRYRDGIRAALLAAQDVRRG